MRQPDICIYHQNCPDGLGSAFAVWKKYGDAVQYIPMNYDTPFDWTPLEARANQGQATALCLVDFSLPRDLLLDLHQQGHTVLVIDHHRTAEAALNDVPFETVFDMAKSGAVLTWEYFHPETAVPVLLQYVQDRDLWKFDLPQSQAVSMYLWSYQSDDFAVWETLQRTFENPVTLSTAVMKEGRGILRYAEKQVAIMAERFTLRTIGGREMPVVNATCLFSEVGDWLCQHGHEAAAYWFQRGNVFQWGLRSRGNIDVSAIAQQYGGGGHFAAAGFVRTEVQQRHLMLASEIEEAT